MWWPESPESNQFITRPAYSKDCPWLTFMNIHSSESPVNLHFFELWKEAADTGEYARSMQKDPGPTTWQRPKANLKP